MVLVDIGRGPDPTHDLAVVAANGDAACEKPAKAAVGSPPQAVLVLVRATAFHRRAPETPRLGQIVGMDRADVITATRKLVEVYPVYSIQRWLRYSIVPSAFAVQTSCGIASAIIRNSSPIGAEYRSGAVRRIDRI